MKAAARTIAPLSLLSALSLDGAPIFADLPAERTGITFRHSFAEDHPLARLYHAGYACGAICIGDVNGDRRPDLYVVDGPAANALFLNRGGFKFAPSNQPALAGGDLWGTGATLVDIDSDGDLDLCQANYDAPLQFFRNDGKGQFELQPGAFGLEVTDAVMTVSFADPDNDGDLDAFVLCNQYYRAGGRPAVSPLETFGGVPAVKREYEKYYLASQDPFGQWRVDNYGRANYFFLNEGTRDKPKFRDVSRAAGVANFGHSLSCVWWDFDADRDLDLYVANDFLVADRLYRNEGTTDGIPRFVDVAGEVLPSVTWSSMGSDLGDINNDGRPDLFVADMSATTHFKAKVSMGDMMGEPRYILETGWPRQAMRNHLFLSNGTPMPSESAWAAGVASTDWSWAPKLADFDQDGFIDLIVTNGMTRNFTDADHSRKIGNINAAMIGHSLWDLHRDLEPLREKNLAFRNLDGRRFQETSADWGLDLEGLSYGSAYGDLDGDGDLDLVVSDLGQRLRVYENRSADFESVRVRLRGTASNRMGIGARVTVIDSEGTRRYRWMLPWTGFQSQNDTVLHFGLGDAAPMKLLVDWPSGVTQDVIDFGVGGVITIAERILPSPQSPHTEPWFRESAKETGLDFKHEEKKLNDYAIQPLLPGKLSQLGPALAAGDADGDGDLDLYAGAASYQDPVLFLNDKGTFQQMKPSPFRGLTRYAEDLDALWFDADGDQDLDLYVVSGSVEQPPGDSLYGDRLYINRTSKGQLELVKSEGLPELADAGSCVAAADFDRDGDLDLFVGARSIPGQYPLPAPGRLLQNKSLKDKLRFVDVTQSAAPSLLQAGLITGACWSDLDADGDPDLLLASEWGPLRFFLNDGKGAFVEHTEAAGLSSRRGWWSALRAADLDGDGDTDFLAGNVGWNTKYGRPSSEKPAVLYYGDMDGTGTKRLVEGKNAEGRLLPVRGKSCSTHAMTSLADKFPTYRDFAACDLAGLFGDARLARATKFEATCFESGVLLNDTEKGGPPRFRWIILPWEAQLSPINDFAVADFDGDGALEIACAQNHFTREAETGLWRGNPGCVFRWKENAPQLVPPHQTGLFLPNDTKALASGDFDLDGKPDLAAAQNDDALLLFLHPQPSAAPEQSPSPTPSN